MENKGIKTVHSNGNHLYYSLLFLRKKKCFWHKFFFINFILGSFILFYKLMCEFMWYFVFSICDIVYYDGLHITYCINH